MLRQFANDNQLWDIGLQCIEILQPGDGPDSLRAVEDIWKALVHEVLESAGYGQEQNVAQSRWDDRMANKFKEIGERFARDPNKHWLFPTEYLVAMLETYNVEFNADAPVLGAVSNIMRAAGVSENTLIETYLQFFQRGWSMAEKPMDVDTITQNYPGVKYQILYNVYTLLSRSQPEALRQLDQLEYNSNYRQLLSMAMAECGPASPQDQLLERFKQLQERAQPMPQDNSFLMM